MGVGEVDELRTVCRCPRRNPEGRDLQRSPAGGVAQELQSLFVEVDTALRRRHNQCFTSLSIVEPLEARGPNRPREIARSREPVGELRPPAQEHGNRQAVPCQGTCQVTERLDLASAESLHVIEYYENS